MSVMWVIVLHTYTKFDIRKPILGDFW